ncbi:ABC transporter substrate-binding protein [Bacillus sp. SD088]|uniref:ABC transporter substrate-binding protein n=1 Tax=Bacillus sp. SD088 TaxID=2782012 RepID=UPI001A97353F|nr:extracellular solute-binding protein [Bacillus sp. SD088]MBO0994745.1 extracellular solute-binding protein [Bacillus sp. SD088]
MERFAKFIIINLLGIMLILVLTACKSGRGAVKSETDNVEASEDNPVEDITLNVVYPDAWEEKRFNEEIKEPVEREFPHIKLKYLDQPIEDLLAKKIMPDIIFLGNPSGLPNFTEHGLTMDMSELIEKHDFDLNRIEPSLLAESRMFADGNLYTLPYTRGITVLHYNKDIFDMFGVDYPKDDMTWDEIIDLAAKLTGEKNGVHYYGLQIPYASIMLDQRGVPKVDPETDEPTYTSEKYMPLYQEYLRKMERVYSIPGNVPEGDDDRDPSIGPFFGDRNVAMNPIWSQVELFSEDEGFNFDIVTYPNWKDRPGISRPSRSGNIGVASSSAHPDEAFKVIAYLFTDEIQRTTARKGRASSLADPTINDDYLGDLIEERPWMEELNIDAMTKHSYPTDLDRFSPYEEDAYAGLEERLLDGVDINTILREAQEEAETAVKEAKEKK